MKETGIIMSGNHPRLILDGIKTQTRRVIKLKPPVSEFGREWSTPFTNDGVTWIFTAGFGMALRQLKVKCPYGQVGDRLWVKETWQLQMHSGCYDVAYKDGRQKDAGSNPYMREYQHLTKRCWQWRSPYFMPRWASRILLEIARIRAERLQEIENHPEDYKAEGYQPFIHTDAEGAKRELSSSLIWFSLLWDSLNAKRGFSWESNPWVWVIDFQVVNT
jgi:hypothetical protein